MPSRGSSAKHGATPIAPVSAANPAQDYLTRVKKTKKKSKTNKVFLGVFFAILVVFCACGAGLALWVSSINKSIGFEDELERDALLDTLAPVEADAQNAYYVAILGSDSRTTSGTGRSDVTMLARIDEENGVVDLISIPRDTMVTIEGHGTQKINAAYAYEGAAGAVQCISEFAGVPITHYVEVHFDELKNVVDMLGGIWVNVPESFSAGNGGMAFSAGEQLINGEQALAFARERYNVSGGDFGRAQAQRMIVEGIVNKVLECSPIELPSVVGQLANCVTTDLSVSDLVLMARDFQGSGLTMYSAACPSYSLNMSGISYVGTMYDEWQDMMRRVDAGLDPNDTSAVIPEPQASDTTLGAATNAASPKDYEGLAANAGLTTDDVASVD